MQKNNLFRDIPATLAEEYLDPLVTRAPVRIERIVSRGHSSPEGFWYDQEEDEWVVLLSGEATLEFQAPDETLALSSGDWILIPAGRRHRVVSTSTDQDCVWLAVFFADR